VLEAGHGSTALEAVTKSGVESVVEDGVKRTLIACNVWKVVTEDLTDGIDTSFLAEFSPEVLGDIRDGIDSESIKVVGLNEVLNPFEDGLLDERMVLVKIRKTTEPASFHTVLVSWVNMSAVEVVVVVFRLVEGDDSSVVPVIYITNVVGHNINHHPDVLFMANSDEFLEFFSSTEVLVDLIEIAGPVSVVTVGSVGDNRGDPNGIEAHTLDVVEIVLDSLEGTSTVVTEIVARSSRTVSLGESVSDDLVDRAGSPFFSSLGLDGKDEKRGDEKGREEVFHKNKK